MSVPHLADIAARRLGTCAVLLTLGGCASPGVPRPPSLHLPAPVRDLRAVRSGDRVQLTFTAPTETTDHQPFTGRHGQQLITALLCRVEAARCTEVARLPVLPGQGYETQEVLPPALTVGAPRPLRYRVRVVNAAGRDAGPSRDALTAAGQAPAAITGLAATTVAQGVRLLWQQAAAPSPVRVEAQTEGETAGQRPAARLLQTPPAGPSRDPGGAVDREPAPGTRVSYRVYRQRTAMLDGVAVPLNGAAATVTAIRGADVFPPAAPTGLIALSAELEGSGPGVTLSWEPNAEPDVSAYVIYRAVGDGPMARLSTAPVRGVSFQDSAVHAGEHLRYAVTALDGAGNESAKSAPVDVDVR